MQQLDVHFEALDVLLDEAALLAAHLERVLVGRALLASRGLGQDGVHSPVARPCVRNQGQIRIVFIQLAPNVFQSWNERNRDRI